MTKLLISYDLNSPGRNYEPLWEAIKALGAWWHYLDSTWIVITNQSATTARDALKPLTDANDELLVVDITGSATAWKGFSDHASTWLTEH